MIPNGYWMIDQLPEEWKEKVRFSAFPGNKLIASPETFGWAVVSTYSEEVKEGAVEFLKFRTKFNLEEKKEQVISSIEEQGKMTEEKVEYFNEERKRFEEIYATKTADEWCKLLTEGRYCK